MTTRKNLIWADVKEPPCEFCAMKPECAEGLACESFVKYVANGSNWHPITTPTQELYKLAMNA